MTEDTHTIGERPAGYALPLDVIGIIANYLISDTAFETCAALSVTCRAVHQETMPILWRTVLHWGYKSPKSFLSCTNNLDSSRSHFGPDDERGKEVISQFVRLTNSSGAKYIEYLFMFPGSPPDVNDMPYILDGPMSMDMLSRLPKLKAMLCLSSAVQHLPGCLVYLSSSFQFGTLDLGKLALKVGQFQRVAHPEKQRPLEVAIVIALMSRVFAVPPPPVAIKNRWNFSAEMQRSLTSFKLRKPHIIASHGVPNSSITTDFFLDILYWCSRIENRHGSENNYLSLYGLTIDQFFACAKALQKATAIHPTMATVDWQFVTAQTSLSEASLTTMHRALAIIRGTYLQAATSIGHKRIGKMQVQWNMDQDLSDTWTVGPVGPPDNALVTSMWHQQPWDGYGARDLWIDDWLILVSQPDPARPADQASSTSSARRPPKMQVLNSLDDLSPEHRRTYKVEKMNRTAQNIVEGLEQMFSRR